VLLKPLHACPPYHHHHHRRHGERGEQVNGDDDTPACVQRRTPHSTPHG
jgi:hypothetical protein